MTFEHLNLFTDRKAQKHACFQRDLLWVHVSDHTCVPPISPLVGLEPQALTTPAIEGVPEH